MKLFNRNLAVLAAAAFAMVAIVVSLSGADVSAAGLFAHDTGALLHDVVRASPVLLSLRAEHAGLVQKATAKIAEVKDGLAPEAVARIEAEHAELVASADAIQLKIDAEVKRQPADPAVKPWASAFYAAAETSGLALKDLNAIVSASATHESAKDALIDAMAMARNAGKPSPTGARASVGMEAGEKFITGATRALIGRTALFNRPGGRMAEDGERNEFTGLTLRELARVSMEGRGLRPSSDAMTMIGAAMQPIVMSGALSTSDFVNILANVANKAMLKGYEESPETFSQWTGKGTLTDFKTTTRVDLGLFPSLTKVVEGAEYTYAKVSDRGVNLVLATYGKIFAITRQAIVNDDLGAFTKVPAKMGNAAKRTIGDMVYAILTSNPNAPDGVALFHVNHGNLATGAGSVLSATSLDAGRAAMGKQKDPDNIKAGLNIRPAYWLGPIALEGTAKQIFQSQSEPGQDNPGVGNRVSGMATPVTDARLDAASSTAWYLAGDPSQYDTIEVDYLNGVEAPTLEQKDGWNVDGVEMKVRMDAGVTLLDHRALYKSAGA